MIPVPFGKLRVVITMPVYEDWESAVALLEQLDLLALAQPSWTVKVLLIDDGSVRSRPPDKLPFEPVALESISVLPLLRNLGHQRAICVSLAYLQGKCEGDVVVIMDADGEDSPSDVPRLIAILEAERPLSTVFAARQRRLEARSFRIGYWVYRGLHTFLTGRDIRFGNFSALPWEHLRSLVLMPELWNHYAAAFLKSRLPYARCPADRHKRIFGHSHMNFVNLVVHGLSALSANQEVVGVRLLLSTLGLALVLTVLIVIVVSVRTMTELAIPGWATATIGILLILIGQVLISVGLVTFLIMMNRSAFGFLPARDYHHFAGEPIALYP